MCVYRHPPLHTVYHPIENLLAQGVQARLVSFLMRIARPIVFASLSIISCNCDRIGRDK